MEKYYWRLPEQKVWGLVEADFVEYAGTENLDYIGSIEELRARIKFYGGQLGPLKNKKEKIDDIMAEFYPGLKDLHDAYIGALMFDDKEVAELIIKERQGVLEKRAKAIQEVEDAVS